LALKPLSLLQLAAAGVVANRLTGARRPLAPVEPSDATTAATALTVVIPARDEVARLGPCVSALVGAPGVVDVIVVDDASTDGTAVLARSLGARVVAAGPLPDGWAGKVHALRQGVASATTEWVVTLDADTRPDPGLPAALVARARADGWHFLTAAGRFSCPTAPLQLLHPALLTSLIYRYGPPGARRRPSPQRAMANGQCMVFRRDHVLAAHAFEAVHGSLVEDVAMARYLAGLGWNVGFLDASSLLMVAMHTSALDAWRGWGRSLPLGGVASGREQASGLAVVWLAMALPVFRVVTGRARRIDALLVALRVGTLFGTRRAYDEQGLAYWLSPLADPLVAARLTQSTLRPERHWRGRTY
jgi:dolichol-phosphate mannosyltransferase